MPDKPTTDDGNLEALETLHRSAGPPPPNRPAKGPSAPRLRCLHCGYGLLEQSGFRCSECGTQYRIETLNRWFSGQERNRFERVLWLVRAALLIHILILPDLLNIVRLDLAQAGWMLAAGAIGWACFLAGRGKYSQIAGHYAVGGIAVASILAFQAIRGSWGNAIVMMTPALCALDAIGACLLLLAMIADVERVELWGARRARVVMLAMLVALPLLAASSILTANALRGPMTPSGFGAVFAPPVVAPSLLRIVVQNAPLVIGLLSVWVYVWRWLAGFQARILAPEK